MSKIEDEVCEEIQRRAATGLNKYGVTMERGDLTTREWMQHLLEELLDAAVYVKRLMHEFDDMVEKAEKQLTTGQCIEHGVYNCPEDECN